MTRWEAIKGGKKGKDPARWEVNCPVKWLHSSEEAAEPLMLRGRGGEEEGETIISNKSFQGPELYSGC